MSTSEQMAHNMSVFEEGETDPGLGPFAEGLGITFAEAGPERAVATMPIDKGKLQPMGALAGGATVSLLETVASRAAAERTDFATERCFGYDVEIHHRKPGLSGSLTGVADLFQVNGNSQTWSVTAFDDQDDIVSYGTVVTKIVSLERLAQKDAERDAKRTSLGR